MAIHAIYTVSRDDAEARNWLGFLRRHGYPSLRDLAIERVCWLEGDVDVQALLPLVANPLYQTACERSMLDPARGPVVEIAYRPAVTDPETPSILTAARALGQPGLEFARLSRRYQFPGFSTEQASEAAARFLYNPVVQRVRPPDEIWSTLRPTGQADHVRSISLAGLDDQALTTLSRERSWYAPLAQMKVIQAHEAKRGRPHTDAEIEILVQSWSDHCYHTTWKSLGLLKQLSQATAAINHPLVVSAFKDNAGGMEFYDGWVVTIKGETHNFPTAIAPFGGISTKHGGVIRDTLGFGKGAYPIGGTTIMGTEDPRLADADVPAGALHPRLIVSESIRGTAYYVNPMGIPMLHPIYRIHPGYAKCFALGHSIGLIPLEYALKETPQPGDVALLIGGETGRDGIHGATASSASMTGETLAKESAAVQIGHPITERKFTTAIPVLRDAGLIRSITDLGAGGISSAAGEMAAETGVLINLDWVPLKDQSLTAWEILLSESQERMLLAVSVDNLSEAQRILDRFEVPHAMVGCFTDLHSFVANWKGQQVVDVEMSFLWGACPIEATAAAEPVRNLQPLNLPPLETPEDWSRAIHGVLSHYHCCDQSAAGVRFDSTVQGRTVIGPYGGRNHRMPTNISVSAPLRGKPYGLVTTVAFNPFYGEIDPAAMARMMVIEAITKAVVAGVDYREMVLCDNFYTPRLRPDVAWDLKAMVTSIAELSVQIGVPFISGKDSSSGTFESAGRRIDVPPTLAVATMGRVPDVKRVVTKDFKRAGNKLFLVGVMDAGMLGGTVYADSLGQRGDRLFEMESVESILLHWDALLAFHKAGLYVSGSAIAEGGLALRLFEASHGSGLGVNIDVAPPALWFGEFSDRREYRSQTAPRTPAEVPAFVRGRKVPDPRYDDPRVDSLLFGEFIGSALVEMTREGASEWQQHLPGYVPCTDLGQVTSEPRLVLVDDGKVFWEEDIASLADIWSQTFREVVG